MEAILSVFTGNCKKCETAEITYRAKADTGYCEGKCG
jgi:hypothetical protein